MSEIIDIQTFTGDNEEELWVWLGDAYLKTEEFVLGDNDPMIILHVKTINGEEECFAGQIMRRHFDNSIEFVTEKWCEENLEPEPVKIEDVYQ